MKKIKLVGIDWQNSFCNPKGELYVTNAEKSAERFALMLGKIGSKIDDVDLTFDSHHFIHIAHPIFWKDKQGNHPKPFTLISLDDVKNGVWRTTKPSLQKWANSYVENLQKNGKYVLVVWPVHCLIGSWGQTLIEPVEKSVYKWSADNFAYFNAITKGSNILTEHYSAVIADVPDPQDLTTQLNVDFIRNLEEYDIILFTGQASNFCVFNTLRDTVENFSDIKYAQKIHVIKDLMDPVPGFDAQEQALWDFCKKHNITVTDSKNPY